VKTKQRRVQFHPENLCPCGSGMRFAGCCMQIDGHMQKALPSSTPSLPKTGFSQRNCYLGGDGNCSEGITAEHYISKAVLQVLGEQIKIDGMLWLLGEEKIVGINSLTAKLLCKRHNNALSPLDSEAGNFCR
jgi:hypothetical protein